MKGTTLACSRLYVGLFFFLPAFFLSVSAAATDGTHGPFQQENTGVPVEMARAIERDLGLTPAEFQELLRMERKASALIERAENSFGEHYGGSWIEHNKNASPQLVVATTSMAATKAAASRLEIGRDDSGAMLREVRFSLSELERTVDSFNQAAARPLARELAGIHSWGVDLPNNRVVVVTATEVTDQALDFFAASDVDLDILEFQVSEHPPSTLANVVGGFRYNNCSIGFAIRRGTTKGFVTAGHCGSVGTLVRIGGVAVGYFQRSDFPGADAAWANVRQSDNLYNLVWRYSGSSTYAVTGSSEAPIGATVCRSGFRTGWRCGTLTRNNVSVNYGSGMVYGLRESNACAGQGDSGGSWVASANQAQGVTSGGALGNDGTNCGIPQNQRRTWFQRLNPMLNSYGLTLVTN